MLEVLIVCGLLLFVWFGFLGGVPCVVLVCNVVFGYCYVCLDLCYGFLVFGLIDIWLLDCWFCGGFVLLVGLFTFCLVNYLCVCCLYV